jgi:hypothetical protein
LADASIAPGKESSGALQLLDLAGEFYANPLGFVQMFFPWREPGNPLEHFSGPDEWQCQELREIGEQVRKCASDGRNPVSPIRRAVASGHGIGKSALVAWIVFWLMSTRPDSRSTVTANTYVQLETKTWAAIQQWHRLCLTAPWFVCTTNRLYHRDSKETWFCSPATCKEENSEAFAGRHAADASSFYIFDEASAVPDKIFEVAEGGLTDGHPFILLYGNPRRPPESSTASVSATSKTAGFTSRSIRANAPYPTRNRSSSGSRRTGSMAIL